jgi:uncharacterized membrane protein
MRIRLHKRDSVTDERGQITVLIVGFFMVMVLLMVMVTDASAAFIHRQRLDSLADGAALAAADAASQNSLLYRHGVGGQRLPLNEGQALSATTKYVNIAGTGLPGLTATARLRGDQVIVTVSAPLRLPVRFPGLPAPTLSASATASVLIAR